MNMYGAFLHVLGDALGSVVVVITALIDWKVDVPFLQNYLDPILSILVAIMLTWGSVSLMKASSLTLLQAVPTSINLINLKDKIMKKSHHILELKNLHVWQLSSEKSFASVRILFDDTLPWEKMIALVSEVEACCYEEGVHVVTVHPEVNEDGDQKSLHIVDGIRCEPNRRRCGTCCRDEPDSGIFVTPSIQNSPSDKDSIRSVDGEWM